MPVHVIAIGEVLAGQADGRQADRDVVLFHCTGLGIQDASLAWSVVELAAERQRGRTVDF